jgi:hypothetical protein
MPDNASYMHAAFIAAALILGGYIASLMLRARALARRRDAIDTVARP